MTPPQEPHLRSRPSALRSSPNENSWARLWMSLVVHCLLLQSFDIVSWWQRGHLAYKIFTISPQRLHGQCNTSVQDADAPSVADDQASRVFVDNDGGNCTTESPQAFNINTIEWLTFAFFTSFFLELLQFQPSSSKFLHRRNLELLLYCLSPSQQC